MRELNEEKQIVALKDSVRIVFGTDSITDTFLRAYEETARNKLIDFADYLKIVSDTSLGIEFRQHAAEMISRIFISGEVKTGLWSSVISKSGINSLEQLLDKSLSDGMISWVEPLQINVRKPLTILNDSTLTGALSFYQRKIHFNSNITPDSISKMFVIDIYVLKKVKSFDKEQIRIWEVFLGDIR
jgi:hypothetical protein